jgi:uncharacterized membrane protein
MKDYVDITLVLGTPLLAFGFQVGLVRGMPFGLAFTALGLGGFYLALGISLWRSGQERMRLMVETFAVVGVIFGTLAVPFALDARWTAGRLVSRDPHPLRHRVDGDVGRGLEPGP